jgi:hypothetical protein
MPEENLSCIDGFHAYFVFDYRYIYFRIYFNPMRFYNIKTLLLSYAVSTC